MKTLRPTLNGIEPGRGGAFGGLAGFDLKIPASQNFQDSLVQRLEK